MEKKVTVNEVLAKRGSLETEAKAAPDLVFPQAAKYEVTYTKANGETNQYTVSNPIEEDANSFTAYVFGRGVRTFIKSRVRSFTKAK
jgi:hypothetical protein